MAKGKKTAKATPSTVEANNPNLSTLEFIEPDTSTIEHSIQDTSTVQANKPSTSNVEEISSSDEVDTIWSAEIFNDKCDYCKTGNHKCVVNLTKWPTTKCDRCRNKQKSDCNPNFDDETLKEWGYKIHSGKYKRSKPTLYTSIEEPAPKEPKEKIDWVSIEDKIKDLAEAEDEKLRIYILKDLNRLISKAKAI